jgi:uncharacterized membrane protein
MAKETEEQRLVEQWLPSREELTVWTVGVLAIGGLYFVVSDAIRVGPPWLLLVLEGILIAPVVIAHLIMRKPLPERIVRLLALALLAVLIVVLVISLIRFIQVLPDYLRGPTLLLDGSILWIINILIFATVYWELDGGGPRRRHVRPGRWQDFMFPQQQFDSPDHPNRWKPGYIDYIFLAFCFSTAFSPADSFPLTRGAKLLVMLQALFSLVIAAVIISRAINILGSR